MNAQFHAFFESWGAWCDALIYDVPVYGVPYRKMSQYQTQYLIQLTQIEHTTAHHVVFVIGYANTYDQEQEQRLNARQDRAWHALLQWFSDQGIALRSAQIGIPAELQPTITTYVPKAIIDLEGPDESTSRQATGSAHSD